MAEAALAWFRIVGRARVGREEVLRSGSPARFHEDPENEPTCYAASSLRTAWREISARVGVPLDPRAFRAWRVVFPGARLVDLRDPEQQARQGVTAQELKADPVPESCKTVARALRKQSAVNGLIYESVRDPGGACVAFFLESEPDALTCEPISDEQWEEFIQDARL